MAKKRMSRAKQERSIATREAIIRAAAIVFSKESFAAATLSDIADMADVTQGALYFHFESKRALGMEVITRQHATSVSAGDKFLTDPAYRAVEKIVLILREVGYQIKTDPVVRAGLRLSTESSRSFPGWVTKPYMDWIETFTNLFRDAMDEGDVIGSKPPSALGNFIVQTFTGTQIVSQTVSEWEDLSDRHKEMWEILIPALIVKDRQQRFSDLPNLTISPMNEAVTSAAFEVDRSI